MPGRKAVRKETIYEQTKKAMKKLGTYKDEYLPLVDIYSELKAEYIKLHAEYKEDGYPYSEPSAQGGDKKAPIVSTLEGLRKDILAYSDRLMLNPKAFADKNTVKKKGISALASALMEVEKN